MPRFTIVESFELAPGVQHYSCGKCGRVRRRADYAAGEWWVCCRNARFLFLGALNDD